MMMSWKLLRYAISLVVVGVLVSGCTQSDYTKLVKAELAKGIRQDSLLLGIYFGDTRNDFYGKCFDLNKQQLISQGPNNVSVQYIFTDSLLHHEPTEIRLLFFPSFDEGDKISDMEMEFSYLAWAPWNEKFQSDSLKGKVMELLMHWYGGNEFVTASASDMEFPVKLDGNRRVVVLVKDVQSITVRVQDILHPRFKHSINGSAEKKSEE
jgi:hypothetical protein